jgi:hypothetical protein
VLEHEEEFKHLKGADMDEFFGLKEPPPKPTTLRGASIRKMVADALLEAKNGSNS